MGLMHKLEISWDDLLDAFTSGQMDRVYFLDRVTGEIFFVHSTLQDDEFWQHIDAQQERFLEIPRLDFGIERQIMATFIATINNSELKRLLGAARTGKATFVNLNDILEFYPEEQTKLLEMKDNFVTSRMKVWLEEHNLFTSDSMAQIPQIR